MATGKNDPAFPKAGSDGVASQRGMTLREYFAGQALIAMGNWTPLEGMVRGDLIKAMASDTLEQQTHRARAAFAVAAADALIAELDR